jgi:hypothetical protein
MTYFPPFVQHFTESCWWMVDLHLRPSGHLWAPRLPNLWRGPSIMQRAKQTSHARWLCCSLAKSTDRGFHVGCGACKQPDARMDCSVSQASGDYGGQKGRRWNLSKACVVTWLWRGAGLWLVVVFIEHLQNVTTNNYYRLTPKITVTTAHIKSSLAVAW